MSIFVVFRVMDPERAEAAIATAFAGDAIKLQDDEWLISANMTAKEVSDRLGFTDGTNGSAIIFKMSGYFGRATTEIWDWIKTKSEASV